MAESSSRCFSETIIAGSEEDFDIICDFCHAEHQERLKAVVFCIPCMEHLCIECKRNHKKTSATKNHVFQDMSQLAVSFERKKQSPRSQDAISDRCPKHPDEQIKCFCSSHQQLACGVCVQLYHITCDDNVSYIKDICGKAAQSNELQDTLAELKKLITTLEAIHTHAKQSRQQMEETFDQPLTDIKQFRQTINQHIDKLTVELFLKASKLRRKTIQSGTSQMPTCDSLIEEIKEIKCDLDEKCDLKRNSQLFIALKSIKEKIQSWESEAGKLSRSVKESHFFFHRDAKLEEVTTVSRLGTVSLQNCPKSAKFLLDINIKLAKDESDCFITGIAVLADGRLAVNDRKNKCVKLVDTAACKVTESLSLTSEPWDITVVDGDQLAVALYRENHIQLLNLTPNLSLSHTLPVPCWYSSITYSEGNYILVCDDPVASLHICDKSGQLLSKTETDKTGNKLFSLVSKVAVSPDQSTIYVIDCSAKKVVCLNRAGVVIATYSNARLGYPWGLAVVDCGCVLLCCWADSSVLLLSEEGSEVKVLLGREDGLERPWDVAYSHDTIYVSSVSSNTIKAFTLEQ